MLKKEIIAFLSIDENQDIELATNLNLNIIGSHICAFLNTNGGFIIYESTHNNHDISVEQVNDIEAELQKNIRPSVLFSFEIQKIDNKQFLVIEIPAGKDKPYSYLNDIFIRDVDETAKADIESIRDMILLKQIEPERWERRTSELVSEDEISENELSKLISAKRIPAEIKDIKSDVLQQLQLLSLAKYNQLTNAGDIILSKKPANRHPQVRVRAVAYQDKSDNDYQDFRNFEGPLLEVFENVSLFIEQNMPTRASFSDNSHNRIERSLYPLMAIREGLVNAFAHRDYSSFSGGILVEISKNKIKIWNSGSFPNGMNEEKIKKGHISILRNPDIAHILYIRNYMEKLGRGSVVIQEACKDYGLPEPKWTSDKDLGVTLTFYAPIEKVNTNKIIETPVIDKKISTLLSILEGELSRLEIQEKLGLKDADTVRVKYLKPALNSKLIERTIPDKVTSKKQKYRLTGIGKELKTIAS